jgi:TolB-like protein/Tfp pilus assembly protein PilF
VPAGRLDSWKEIAAYLGRSVRTVQRWEQQEALPVHRLQHDKQGSVYALTAELDAWWESRRVSLGAAAEAEPEPAAGAVAAAEPVAAEQPVARSVRRIPRAALLGLGAAAVAALAAVVVLKGRSADAAPPRLAVLPFANLTGDPAREFLSDGFTEAMIAELGRRRDLGVIARSSVLAYKTAPRPPKLVGQELGVDYVLEGSVREDGARVHVTAQLVGTRDATTLWSEVYHRPRGDLMAVEAEVAARVADEIHLRLPPPPGERASPEAHVAYLRGRFHWNQRSAEGFAQGLAFFQEAVTQDPQYARAWSGIADTYMLSATYGYAKQADAAPRAREAAEKALALDPSLGEAHASLALVRYYYDWDFAGAEQEFRRAAELAPSYANARLWLGLLLFNQGRLEDARAVLRQGLDLDPASVTMAANLAYCDLFAGNAAAALQQFESLRQRHPERRSLATDTARAHLALGHHAEAIRLLEEAVTDAREPHLLALLAYAYASAGRKADGEAIRGELEAQTRRGPVDLSLVAIARTALGHDAAALDVLETAVQERQGSVLTIKVDPELAALRTEPRFQALLKKIGLS